MRLQGEREQAVLRRHAQARLMHLATRISLAAAIALPLILAACFGKESAPCPHITIMDDLKSVAKFGNTLGRTPQDVQYGARMIRVAASCTADRKRNGVLASSKLGIVALRNDPKLLNAQVVYFVAVVDRRQNILVKRDFNLDIKFPPTQTRVEMTEFLDTFIPLAQGTKGDDYGILFGFEVTPEELQYNRSFEPRG